ncbi:MAG: DNA replication/repair protein RecF [Cyanobacteria bacterium P01_H01_bin.15]
MFLDHLHLRSFRNYQEQVIPFSAQKTILVGNNAQGKSNLLEAVELLATLKSHRTSRDRDLVQEGSRAGQIEARVQRAYGTAEIKITLRSSGRRSLMLNQETLRRNQDLLGIINAVQFSSLDLELVRGGPEARRVWIDTLLSQLEPVYTHVLQQYNHVLQQRNALLKTIRQREHEGVDIKSQLTQLALWDEQLVVTGTRVCRRRARVLDRLTPIASQIHHEISSQTEQLRLTYLPNVSCIDEQVGAVQQAFRDRITERRQVERIRGTSVVGPHRDDIEFAIDETPARSYGSQGQQRTLVLALKMAELRLIEEVVGEPPLLLLDDVLAELDPQRQTQLLETIQDHYQTVITTTHINSFDGQWLQSSQILKVEAGALL